MTTAFNREDVPIKFDNKLGFNARPASPLSDLLFFTPSYSSPTSQCHQQRCLLDVRSKVAAQEEDATLCGKAETEVPFDLVLCLVLLPVHKLALS